jgi:hypothetical protein
VTALAYPEEKKDDERPGGYPVPKDIKDRVERGREASRKDANLRRLCHKMWAGEHYWYLNVQGALRVLSTALVDMSGGKPGHRIRNTYNFLAAIIEAKTSAATSRTPGYEIDPSSARTSRTSPRRGSRSRSRSTGTTAGTSAAPGRRRSRSRSCSAKGSPCPTSTRA